MNTKQKALIYSSLGLTALQPLILQGAIMNKMQTESKPNILFIFADDLSFEAIGAAGYLNIKTPNLNKLLHSSVHFTHAYNMGSWSPAICMASRSMLNSGLTVNNCQESIKKHPIWPELLKSAGYKTYFTGKWHVPAVKPKFDVIRHVRKGMPKQTPEGYNRPKDEEEYKNGWKPWDKSKEGYWKGGTHWTEVVANDTLDYLKDASKNKSPFFMYIAFNAPHDPRQSPKKYIDMYPLKEVDLPKDYLPEYPFKNAMGCPATLRDERLAPFPRTKYAIKVNRQEYYAAITYMDEQIGRIIKGLKDSGKEKNTYIIFTADQGLSVGHHGLMGKQNMFDPAIRVPLFIKGPGITAGTKIETPIYLQDIMPTTLELANTPIPKWVEFKSLLPILKGKKKNNYKNIYGKYLAYQRMIIKDDYKLIVYPQIHKYLLFNLKKDRNEMHNLANNPEYASKLKALKQELIKEQKKYTDDLNIDNPYPPKQKKEKSKKSQ
jgi:choline-sulfatase